RSIFVFFFQAEDGIRDFHVTGVQTCALPISSCSMTAVNSLCMAGLSVGDAGGIVPSPVFPGQNAAPPHLLAPRVQLTLCDSRQRSEERRVGKECRSGWAA